MRSRLSSGPRDKDGRQIGRPQFEIDKDLLLSIELLARKSTRALEILVDQNGILFITPENLGKMMDFAARLRRLREVMVISMILEMMLSSPLKPKSENLSLDIDGVARIATGSDYITFKLDFDASKFQTQFDIREKEAATATVEQKINAYDKEASELE